MKKSLFKKQLIVFLLLLFILSLASLLQANGLAVVSKIIDGDTLKVTYGGIKESVRLIGIDTPESRVNDRAKRQAKRSRHDIRVIISQGKKAKNFVKALIKPGDIVRIEFDIQQRDRYKRLLGYVYLSDGRMLNEEIIKAGYANLLTIPPNVKYRDRFRKAYRYAVENKRGLWSDK